VKTNEHKPLPPIEYLRTRLKLERSTGKLYWKRRPVWHFKTPGFAVMWNKRFAGREAGGEKGRGYRCLSVDSVRYHAHRVVFALATGRDPGIAHVDHISGGKNNKPHNLQASTNQQNVSKRSKLNRNNTSGVAGVYWHRASGKWCAAIKVHGKQHYLGMFPGLAAAARARRKAEQEHFGAFAPTHNRSEG
jgi:hypothetical protein